MPTNQIMNVGVLSRADVDLLIRHWSGDLRTRLLEEIADVEAAMVELRSIIVNHTVVGGYPNTLQIAIDAFRLGGWCDSCGGLNLSCPEGCERDPKTGELIAIDEPEDLS